MELYKEEEFYFVNPVDIEDKYLPYYEEAFKVVINGDKVTSQITDKIYNLPKFNTFIYVKDLIHKGKINHIYEYVNMFFMFKEQYDIIEHRYLRRDRFGNIIENPVQLADRVATFIALSEPQDRITSFDKMSKWYPVFLKKILNMELVPNTPAMVSAGIPGFGSFACVVVDNDDNLEDISKWYKDTAFLNKAGFGIGHSLHKIRPGGSPYGKSKIRTKSSINWLFPIDDLSHLMSQGTSGRAGANMVSIPVWHPDVIDFISFKSTVSLANGGKENARKLMKQIMNSDISVKDKENMVDMIDKAIPLKSFNMSVLVNDKFMQAVEDDSDWILNFGLPDHEHKIEVTKKAKDIFSLICKHAHESGDPGLLFYDRINVDNVVKKIKNGIFTTNPCLSGETMVVTRNGHYKIKDLVGKEVEVFDGDSWVKIDNFRVTGENKEIFRVNLNNGQYVDATEYHKFILENRDKKELKDLKPGDKLLGHDLKIHGNVHINGAYLKGFLLGDGTSKRNVPLLWLYEPKYMCEERLIESANEIETGKINTNAVIDLSFNDSFEKRKLMRGLAPLSSDLVNYCDEYRNGLPEGFLNWDFESKKEFIAGYMDADGSAMDTTNGFAYQISSVGKKLLLDFQLLLRSIGVKSHFGLMKKAEEKDFGDRGGICHTQDCYRLTISQKNSIKISRIIKFERLVSFIDKNVSYNVKSRELKVDSIDYIGSHNFVYCCTVDKTHSFSLSNGIVIGQCGEIPLHPFSVCNLWTINLLKHFDFYHRKITIGKLRDTINVAVRAGDNLTTVNHYPREVSEIEKAAKEERRVGVDFTGLADYLYLSKIKYGTKDAEEEIDSLYKFLRDTARNYSVRLAKKKGSFPLYRKSSYYITKDDFDKFKEKKCPKCGSKIEKFDDFMQCSKCNWAKFLYIRNMHLLTQAPTGTRSRMLGVSFGIEPHYYKWWESTVMEGKSVPGINRILEWYIKSEYEKPGYANFSALCKQINDNTLNPLCLSNWVEAHDLTPEQHLKVQSIIQKWVDQAVSKTINLPSESTVEDIANMYILAWKSGLKGITMYRDGSHFREVIGKKEKCPECDSDDLLKIEGCIQCKACGWGKCSI